MPACNESWKKCKGFWDCTGAAFETAGKCTVSAVGDAVHADNQEARTRAYKQTECLWAKYKKGDFDKEPLRLMGSPVYPSGFVFAIQKQPAMYDRMLKKKLTDQDLQSALHECGQAFGGSWVADALALGSTGLLSVLATPAIGAAWGAALKAVNKVSQAATECVDVSATDALLSVASAGAQWVGVTAENKAGWDAKAAKLVEQVTKGGNTMDSLIALLNESGIEVPDQVKEFLNCLYTKAGLSVLLDSLKQAVVSGDPEGAAKKLAPYAIDCGAKQLANAMPAGPWKTLVYSVAVAIEAAIAPPAAPPKKVPVSGAGSGGACPTGYYKSLTGECKPQPQAPQQQSAMRALPAGVTSCKGPYEPDATLRCPEYNTPFWDNQRKINVPGGSGPDASGAEQLLRDKALAIYQENQAKQQQTQTLVLVGVAVVGLYLLSK